MAGVCEGNLELHVFMNNCRAAAISGLGFATFALAVILWPDDGRDAQPAEPGSGTADHGQVFRDKHYAIQGATTSCRGA